MKKLMTTKWLTVAALIATCAATVHARPARNNEGAKYVFFFLGDGMSSSQIQATEAYLTTLNTGGAHTPADLMAATNRLTLTKLPVQGMQLTYDDGALMTDSASAGTAFACGIKTKSGIVGMNTAKTKSYKSVAQLAKEQGKKVGILSSVSLDHATPASYYASVTSRNLYNDICMQLADTGYNFFGGGGMNGAAENVWTELAANGYTIVNNRADTLALATAPQDKVFCNNPWLQDGNAMPYAIDDDKPEAVGNVSLAEMTEVAISCLEDGPNGFFLMVEGGKVDWACHANDAVATLGDMLAFDAAVAKAVAFYNAHPDDTLIVVTGDHETGGMTIGHATTGYTEHYDRLLGQKCSFQYFDASVWSAHLAAYAAGYDWSKANLGSGDADAVAFTNMIAANFGVDYNALNDYQKEKLEDAYDKGMSMTNDNSSAENTYLYSSYKPVSVTLTHILNENASVGWTSYSHTGVPVPVYAVGFDSYRFEGFYDNTDIAKKIAAAMRVPATLPVEK